MIENAREILLLNPRNNNDDDDDLVVRHVHSCKQRLITHSHISVVALWKFMGSLPATNDMVRRGGGIRPGQDNQISQEQDDATTTAADWFKLCVHCFHLRRAPLKQIMPRDKLLGEKITMAQVNYNAINSRAPATDSDMWSRNGPMELFWTLFYWN